MTEFETASLVLRGVIGLGQIAVVAVGIWVMRSANRDRAQQMDQQMDQQRREADWHRQEADRQRQEADQRHAEAMKAQERRHVEAMEAQERRHAEAMEALRQQGETLRALVKGMETVIERTAPRQ